MQQKAEVGLGVVESESTVSVGDTGGHSADNARQAIVVVARE